VSALLQGDKDDDIALFQQVILLGPKASHSVSATCYKYLGVVYSENFTLCEISNIVENAPQ